MSKELSMQVNNIDCNPLPGLGCFLSSRSSIQSQHVAGGATQSASESLGVKHGHIPSDPRSWS